MTDTKAKILDAAECLFAAKGYDATSLRHIISEAGVNLAAVHYHFGSKEELLQAVVLRRAGPVNERRLALLTEAETEAGRGAPPLGRVLESFLLPMAEMAAEHPQMIKLMGRLHMEGLMPSIRKRHFQMVIDRFEPAMRRVLNGLTEEEFEWRMRFMVGAVGAAMFAPPESQTDRAGGDYRVLVARLLTFLQGGLSAPATKITKSRRSK
jgi:AcrR family transcriptional regulator